MPPKPAARRPASARTKSSDAARTPSRQALLKPNLPPLQGTPSSRRQYSYGAAEEPPPSRPGPRTRRGGALVLDLDTAVRDALSFPDEDQQPVAEAPSAAAAAAMDQDELALGAPSSNTRATRRGLFHTVGASNASDADEVRSFGLENEYFGDATIASTPGAMRPPPPPNLRVPPSMPVVPSSPLAGPGLGRGAGRAQPSKASRPPDPTPVSHEPPRLAPGEPDDNGVDSPVKPIKVRRNPIADDPLPWREIIVAADTVPNYNDYDDDNDNYPADDHAGPWPKAARPRRTANQPRQPSKAQQAAAMQPPTESRPHDVDSSVSRSPGAWLLNRTKRAQPAVEREPRDADSISSQGFGRWFTRATRPQQEQATEARPRDGDPNASGRWLNRATKAIPNIFSNMPHLPPSWSERRPSPRQPQADDGTAPSRPESSSSLPPPPPPPPPPGAPVPAQRPVVGRGPAINWRRLPNPRARAQAAALDLATLWQRIIQLWLALVPSALRWLQASCIRSLPYAIGVMVALAIGLVLPRVAMGVGSWLGSARYDLWQPAGGGIRWSWSGITDKLGGYMPALPWPSPRWEDIFKPGDLNEITPAKLEDMISKVARSINSLGRSSQLHESAIQKLEAIVPKLVHMELKNGRPVVSVDFYHALRDLMLKDESIFSFDIRKSEYDMTSERQWKAIIARLAGDPTVASMVNRTAVAAAIEAQAGWRPRAGLWDAWVEENEAKVRRMIGAEMDDALGSDKMLKRLATLVPGKRGDQGKVVGRGEYMRILQKEVAALRAEMKAELAGLRPQMEKLMRDSIDLAMRDIPASMTRDEITTLVNGLVRRGLADLDLQALANGKIHVHWDSELKNQINHFCANLGAIIDPNLTSPKYEFEPPSVVAYSSREQPEPPAAAALMPWQDPGDCFCAARSNSRRGNPHGSMVAVMTARPVVAQHIVVEHILPGATTDPGARPRDIEVYARFDDAELLDLVRDFAATHFPELAASARGDWDYTPLERQPNHVKIAEFRYQDAELHDGVHVHRLSSELLALGAASNHYLIRAVSNYGAPDHTCFYRVRMYGRVPGDDGPPAARLAWLPWSRLPW